jgi:hypothetical protein
VTAPHLVAYADPDEMGALYVDGVLDRTGAPREIAARIAELLGVEVRSGFAYLRGTDNEAAPSLEAIDSWVAARDAAREKVERMRTEAQAMLREAARMEGLYR